MADNIPITAGAGTTIATDDIAGVHHQRVKVEWGADGAATDASAAAPLPVTPVPAATGTVTAQTDQATSVQLLASSATRKGFRIYNDSTAVLYLKYGTTASATDFTVKLAADGYLEENFYYGRVDGIWASDASGSARITELT